MLHIFDSLTKTKKPFVPINPNNVRMYVCGPTVYDYIHLGNGRPIVVFDVLNRLLRYLFPKVTYVRNITDIDDKIINRAREEGVSIDEITQRTTKAFHEDAKSLGSMSPDFEPKATEYVKGMVAMIQGLIEKGYAYESKGHVLFRISAYKEYGHLSKFPQSDLEAGARVEVAPYKESPMDFVLWKPSDMTKEPGWESPWGLGRPGWHIECSVMSSALLGNVFDIHGGGIDLIFPHHENECAQSCAFHGTKTLANYWVHNGHVTVDGQKMSKSLGNFTTIRQLLEKNRGDVIRYVLLSAHYKQPLDFSKDMLEMAHNNLSRIYNVLKNFEEIPVAAKCLDEFLECLEDDLNIPQALGVLHKYINLINKGEHQFVPEFKKSCELLGLLPDSLNNNEDSEEIDKLIEARNQARRNKDFAESDKIRDLLKEKGIVIEDTASGTTWHREF